MSITPGTRLGPYEITVAIGAGGMGEVYRARDTKLNRDVAIKVLPEVFALDPDRLTRFTREAQTLAALNHPNIAAIYGIADLPPEGGSYSGGGAAALVMELVEGDDLSVMIARGALPLVEALPIARQIADALEAAHEQGIVHRDLKPANIKVRADGTVKVLDFGLAKATDPALSGANAMHSPTLTARATQMGVILGTAAYMAPEQARGKAVDKRADIWAFGVVLFEMLAGRRPFDGDEITGVLARVLERDPEWTLLPATTPAALRGLLERCLTKDPKARLRDMGEARHAIGEIILGRSGSTAVVPATVVRSTAWIPWSLAAVLALVGGFGWLRPAAATDPARRPTRVELTLPDNVEFYTSPRISTDGRRIAFIGVRDGTRTAYLRELDQAVASPIPGTDGTIFLAFSPDARSIAVISSDARLKRIALDSGAVEDLTMGVDIVGGLHWSNDGNILYGGVTKILSVPATGGQPRVIVTAAENEATIASPASTPDGKTLLFTSWSGGVGAQRPRIEAVPMAGGPRRVVVEDAGYALTTMPGRLLFQRSGSIYSMRFDPERAEVSGTATKLTDEARDSPTGGVAADVNPGGDVVFADTHVFNGRLTWVSQGGVERPIPVPRRSYNNPRVSPDGRTVAYSDASAIWTADTDRGAQSRIFTGTDALTGFPIWSRDGSHLFFRTSSGIVRMRADGGGQPEAIPGSVRTDYPNAVSPDGTMLLITRINGTSSGDIVLLPIAGGASKTLVSTPAYDGGSQFSPDGRWITYVSNTSARMEVYLRAVDGPEQHQVSTSGGIGALWSPDGRRIFFRNAQQFLAVDVTASPKIALSAPKLLFEHPYGFGPNITIANYSLSADGKDFLLVNPGAGHLSLIFNWLRPDGP
jgi:serine/threonine protein kinase/sugar lactone lactonase YvrE